MADGIKPSKGQIMRQGQPGRTSRLRAVPFLAAVLIALLLPPGAHAGSDYSDKDFAVRLPPAFLRFTEVATMGGETVANRMSSAINPASTAWLKLPGDMGVVLAPYYSPVLFDNGTNMHVIGESATISAGWFGVVQPTISQIRTNKATMRNGMTFDYSVDSYQVQWGKRLDKLAVGAMFNYANAEVLQTMPGIDVKGLSDSYRWRFGGLYEPVEKWLLGAILEYGFQPYRSRTIVTIPMGEGPPILVPFRDDGVQHQVVFRPGVSYEYSPMSSVFLDYQLGYFHNPEDALYDHHFTFGIDHRLLEFLFVRANVGIDVRGNVSLGGGISIFPASWCSLDVGYKYDALPELRPEFGRSHTIQVAFNVRF
jgi:hypothetical protein